MTYFTSSHFIQPVWIYLNVINKYKYKLNIKPLYQANCKNLLFCENACTLVIANVVVPKVCSADPKGYVDAFL